MNRIVETLQESQSLIESWGDVIDVTEFMTDTPGFFQANSLGVYTQIYDRADGRYRPVYTNESDLKIIRAMSWLLVERVPMAQAWINRLLDYTIGTGFDWTIKAEDKRLEKAIQAYVRETLDNSKWSSELERESYAREVGEGEVIIEHVYENGQCLAIACEADELTEPASKGELEDWIGVDFVPSWTFGVLTRESRPQNPIGYHFCRNQTGSDWDYVTADKVSHWKRNVRARAKRGFSDFYKPHLYLLRADRVLTNTAEGAATQAAIAYIVEHKDGTQRQADNIVKKFAMPTGRVDPLTGIMERKRKMKPGTRLDVPEGQTYKAGLLGANNSGIYIEVMEAALRLGGSVHAFVEGMLTGSYANNNFASALVAEGPFMQGRLAEQSQRKERVREMILKMIRLGAGKRRFAAAGYESWDSIRDAITVEVIPSRIVPMDPLKTAQALAIQKQNGWVSDKTCINELGRDIDTETANGLKVGGAENQAGVAGQPGAQTNQNAGPQGSDLGNVSKTEQEQEGPWLGLSTLQWRRNRKAITDVLTSFASRKMTRPVAKVLLQSIGMKERAIETILDDASDGQIDSMPQTESLTEAERKTLNKPFRTSGGPKKFSVYVKNEKGNVVKVNFGDPKMRIKRDDPGSRRGFRARHNCDNPGPKWKAKYWSCRMWSKPSVTKILKESFETGEIGWDGRTFVREAWLHRQNPRLLEVRDGDGDGLVDDGKPTQRAAEPKQPKAKKKEVAATKPQKDEAGYKSKFASLKTNHEAIRDQIQAAKKRLEGAKTHEETVEVAKVLQDLELQKYASAWNSATEYGAFHAENESEYRRLRGAQLDEHQNYEKTKNGLLIEWANEVKMRPGAAVSFSNLAIGQSYLDDDIFDAERSNEYTVGNSLETVRKYKKTLDAVAKEKDLSPEIHQAYFGEPNTVSSEVQGDETVSLPSKISRGGADPLLKKFMETAAVAIQVNPQFLASIADKGVLSQSEGGKKGVASKKTGANKKAYLEVRQKTENDLFGLSDKDKRPIYGFLDNPARLQSGSVYAADNYGTAQVILKPSIKARTSYTIGDSLDDGQYGGKAGAVNDPSDHSSVPPTGFYRFAADAEKNPASTIAGESKNQFKVIVRSDGGTREKTRVPNYIEAQIHGGVQPSDIQEVRVPRGQIAPAAKKKLEKAGISVVEIPPPPVENFYNIVPTWETVGND